MTEALSRQQEEPAYFHELQTPVVDIEVLTLLNDVIQELNR